MEEIKSLDTLLESISFSHLAGPDPTDVLVGGVVSDSRVVKKQSLFVALAGVKSDGHSYVTKVIEHGCAAIIIEKQTLSVNDFGDDGVCIISVDNSRETFAKVVAAFYDYPQNSLTFIGITGTNGKTTITYLLEKVLEDRGLQVGVIGTVSYRYTDRQGIKHQLPAPLTTPDPLILQKQLRQMADEGVQTVVMEVSSHALDQKRLGNIQFDIAAFTNLSHDHLDYHQSMDEYFHAKTSLFTDHLKESGQAVVTYKETDDEIGNGWASALSTLLQGQNISYVSCGRQDNAVIQPLLIKSYIDRTEMSLNTPVGEMSLISPLVGRFNVDNIMTTLGIAFTMGLDLHLAAQSLALATGAPGRLERVELQQGEQQKKVVFVDYAHTPDALFNVLQNLKALPHDKLLCVFGCGGDRDVTKRPEMGRIAAELSDVAIVTDDNPRSEPSSAILRQILAGITSAGMEQKTPDWLFTGSVGKGSVVIPSRYEAIRQAIQCASANDIVVIAGKGHEKYQLTNEGKRFFDDCLEAREALFSWDTSSVAESLGTKPINGNDSKEFSSVCTDSRKVMKGQIFVALKGDKFDGHDYIDQVILSGAGCVIISDVSKLSVETEIPVFQVTDTIQALGELAGFRRRKIAGLSDPLVIGITGSCGKTTVKEMTSAIFSARYPDSDNAPLGRVLRTTGNFNNLIGLPLSLLPIELKHRVAILEMGMNQSGEISRLAEIAGPEISCIVNVYGAHLEGLGTIEGVAKAKEELFQGTDQNGILIVNLDDDHVVTSAAKYPHKKVTYTMKEDVHSSADLSATDIRCRDDGKISFILHIGDMTKKVNLKVVGRHNVANCLAAAAIAHAAGTEAAVIVQGLETFQSSDKRLEVLRTASGYSIINDTYNANPASMKAGLATLASMNGQRKIAILGDMLELGEASLEAHKEVGRKAACSGLTYLAVCGSFAQYIAEGALQAGMDKAGVHVFADKDEICAWLEVQEKVGELKKDTWILVKASRGMRFETVVEKIAGTSITR